MNSVTVVSVEDMRVMVTRERNLTKSMLADVKRMRFQIKASREAQKILRQSIKAEVAIARIVRADHRALRMAARIAKTEKRLQELRDKAGLKAAKAVRKAGPVKVFSADEIAALNAANGAV